MDECRNTFKGADGVLRRAGDEWLVKSRGGRTLTYFLEAYEEVHTITRCTAVYDQMRWYALLSLHAYCFVCPSTSSSLVQLMGEKEMLFLDELQYCIVKDPFDPYTVRTLPTSDSTRAQAVHTQ